MLTTQKVTCKCSATKREKTGNDIYSIMSGVFIALIPKCPYCILAYSSAITMCSGTKLYSHSPSWTSYFLLVLAVLTLSLIIFNYKGKRTIVAIILVTLGSLLMLVSQFYIFDITYYYLGTILLLFGVWVNASFRFFYHKWIRPYIYYK